MKRLLTAIIAALMMVALTASTAFGASSKWTLSYYVGEGGPYESVALNPHRGTIASFAFTNTPDQALLTSDATGYVKKGNLLGKTVTSRISITADPGTTFTGYDDGTGGTTPPTVRFYFQTDHNLGPVIWDTYVASLWWSNPVSIPLADLFADGPTTLSVSFDPANWSDTDGHMGNADADHIAWFNEAASHATVIGFSFGSHSNFAFGTGSEPEGALFSVLKFSTYTP